MKLVDATRNSDDAHVQLTLKAFSRVWGHFGIDIAQHLSSETLAADHRNHCVPVHELLPVPEEYSWAFPEEHGAVISVLPRLHDIRKPHFDTIGEAVGFFAKIFEVSLVSLFFERRSPVNVSQGMQWLHGLNIAHRCVLQVSYLSVAIADAHSISDAHLMNIRMDAPPMHSKYWHPEESKRTFDVKKAAEHFSRTD